MMHPLLWFSMAFLPFSALLMLVILLVCMESFHLYFRISPAQLIHRLSPTTRQHLLQRLDAVSLPFFDIALLWLSSMAISGVLLQLLCCYALEHTVFSLYLLIPACIIAIFATRWLSHWLTQVQTATISNLEPLLLGRLATISSGNARPGLSATAQLRDQFGNIHYVAVEPEFGELAVDDEVILFAKKEQVYLAKPMLANQHSTH